MRSWCSLTLMLFAPLTLPAQKEQPPDTLLERSRKLLRIAAHLLGERL